MKQVRLYETVLTQRGSVVLNIHDMDDNHIASFDCKTDKEVFVSHMKLALKNLLKAVADVEVIDGEPNSEGSEAG